MSKILLVALLVVSPASFSDESWIEGRWTVSRLHTIQELSRGDATLEAKLEELIDESKKIWDKTWIVDSGTIQILQPDRNMEPVNYFIRPIEDGVFEMLFDLEGGDQNYVVIHRRSFGFCYRYGGDYSSDPAPETQECYVRDDT